MRSSRYSAEQTTFRPRRAEEGAPVSEVCRKMGISEQTYYRWRMRFRGIGVAKVGRRIS